MSDSPPTRVQDCSGRLLIAAFDEWQALRSALGTEPHTHFVPVSLPPVLTEDHEALKRAAETVLANASADAAKINITCTSVYVPNEFPAEAILKEAKARNCDVIVMASHGRRGLARLVLGGKTVRVVTHSAIPVLVCR